MEEVIKYPLSTEKMIRMMESENKLVFVVDRRATKTDIKSAVEKLFSVKVVSVNTTVTARGIKQAYVKLSNQNPAMDLATQLGLM